MTVADMVSYPVRGSWEVDGPMALMKAPEIQRTFPVFRDDPKRAHFEQLLDPNLPETS